MNDSNKRVVLFVAMATCCGCVGLDGTVRYDDLDQLVHRATGKHLHEPLTEGDLSLLEDKAWGANLGDLVRITDETKRLVRRQQLPAGAQDLTEEEQEQVRDNLRDALNLVLVRVTDMRMLQAKRDIARGGCKSSRAEPTGDTPAC